MIRIRDQPEIQVGSLSVTSIRAQSTTGVKLQSDYSGLSQGAVSSAVWVCD